MYEINFEEIFGVKEVSALSEISGMELLLEAESRKKGDADYMKSQLYRDGNGQYYIAAEGGENAHIGIVNQFYLDNRKLLFPVSHETARRWAQIYAEPEQFLASAEFSEEGHPGALEKLWQFEQVSEEGKTGYIREALMKDVEKADEYRLVTTVGGYPFCTESTVWTDCNSDGTGQAMDAYVCCITSETARRWAKARKMDDDIYKKIFGVC